MTAGTLDNKSRAMLCSTGHIWSQNLTKQQQHLLFKGKMEITKLYGSRNGMGENFILKIVH